jgi:hypothetical protein
MIKNNTRNHFVNSGHNDFKIDQIDEHWSHHMHHTWLYKENYRLDRIHLNVHNPYRLSSTMKQAGYQFGTFASIFCLSKFNHYKFDDS